MTISRGIRVPESRFTRVYEVWQLARKNRTIQQNEVFNVIIELGLKTFSALPQATRDMLFRKRKAKEEIEFNRQLESQIRIIGSHLRLDERMAFALPSPAKRAIREEAERARISMSAIARKRIILQEADS